MTVRLSRGEVQMEVGAESRSRSIAGAGGALSVVKRGSDSVSSRWPGGQVAE